MKNTLIMALLVIVSTGSAICQDPIRAKTDAGKEVILNADGTWKYATEPVSNTKVSPDLNKPLSAKKLFKPEHGAFGIWYDETKWQLSTKAGEPGRTEFSLRRGSGYAIAIVEELGIPMATLKRVALANAKEAASDARITGEELRIVNGKEILCLKIEGTLEQIPFRYYGYYYGGKQGTIQLLTFTGQSLFEKYEQDFSDFLNGLEIY